MNKSKNVSEVLEIIYRVCYKYNKTITMIRNTDGLIIVNLDNNVSFTVFYKFMDNKDIEKLVKEACTFKGLTK